MEEVRTATPKLNMPPWWWLSNVVVVLISSGVFPFPDRLDGIVNRWIEHCRLDETRTSNTGEVVGSCSKIATAVSL